MLRLIPQLFETFPELSHPHISPIHRWEYDLDRFNSLNTFERHLTRSEL